MSAHPSTYPTPVHSGLARVMMIAIIYVYFYMRNEHRLGSLIFSLQIDSQQAVTFTNFVPTNRQVENIIYGIYWERDREWWTVGSEMTSHQSSLVTCWPLANVLSPPPPSTVYSMSLGDRTLSLTTVTHLLIDNTTQSHEDTGRPACLHQTFLYNNPQSTRRTAST